MRSLLAIIALVAVAIGLAAFASHMHPGGALPPAEQEDVAAEKQQQEQQQKTEAAKHDPARLHKIDQYKDGAIRATMVVQDRGTLELELYPKAAPKTVAHFVDLCQKHFYDGLLFHRVHPGFVAQGGDPKSRTVDGAKIANLDDTTVAKDYNLGQSGSGHTVPLEAKLPHLQYTLGLARSQSANSGDSQFFINLVDNPTLDNQYTVFGEVVKGTDVLNDIKQGDRIQSITVP